MTARAEQGGHSLTEKLLAMANSIWGVLSMVKPPPSGSQVTRCVSHTLMGSAPAPTPQQQPGGGGGLGNAGV
jgi:hypothetical protein